MSDVAVSEVALARPGGLSTVRSYVALTKPRIIELLLVTTVPPMVLAARGLPSLRLIALTLVGGSLAAGAANTINCFVDRDIDAVMHRTRKRPLAVHTVSPANALRFGLVLGAAATLVLGLTVNWVSAGLADGAIAVYVFIYSMGLKRRTPNNIVIGGAAGCFPALIGWSAVTGAVGWPAVVLFAVIFLWTPPHFWALAMRYREDYERAGVPMLPVVATPTVVARQIMLYSVAMVGASLLLIPRAGWLYGGASIVLGAAFLLEAGRLGIRARRGDDPHPMRLFHYSITYLTLLFIAAAVAPLV